MRETANKQAKFHLEQSINTKHLQLTWNLASSNKPTKKGSLFLFKPNRIVIWLALTNNPTIIYT